MRLCKGFVYETGPSTAKKKMYNKVYDTNQRTIYCDCTYQNKTPDLAACGYDGTGEPSAGEADHTEAEHIVPASWFGQNRPCWRTNVCPNKGTRACCQNIDYAFKKAHNDLHNLAPAVGQINRIRSNHPYALIGGEDRDFGTCDFEFENDIAEPRADIRGDAARVYFYMKQTYGLTASPQDEALLEIWDQADPVDSTEQARNNKVKAVQGNGNPFVENP